MIGAGVAAPAIPVPQNFFLFKQKPAYELLRSDWSSNVCSSDLVHLAAPRLERVAVERQRPAEALGEVRELERRGRGHDRARAFTREHGAKVLTSLMHSRGSLCECRSRAARGRG